MPRFRAKKRCQYGGNVYEKNEVEQFFTPISAQSWEAMDEEGEELLIYPEEGKPDETGKPEEAEVLVSGEEFAELQAAYNALFDDLDKQKKSFTALQQECDSANQSASDLRVENAELAKAAEAANAQQVSIAELKQMVKDKENKDVLEEAIIKL